MADKNNTQPVGKIDADKFNKLKADAEAYQKLLNSGLDLKKFEEIKKKHEETEARLKKIDEENQKARFDAFRNKVSAKLEEDAKRLNSKNWNGRLPQSTLDRSVKDAVAALSESYIKLKMADGVEGVEIAAAEAKTKLNDILKTAGREFEAFDAAGKRQIMQEAIASPPNLNTLSYDRRKGGEYMEKAFWSHEGALRSNKSAREKMLDWLVSEMVGKPINRRDGSSWLDEFSSPLAKIIRRQKEWDSTGNGKNMFAPGGDLFNLMASESITNSLQARFVAEANESDTTKVVGGTGINFLALDATEAIIRAAYPSLVSRNLVSKSGVMRSTTKRIQEIGQPRDGDPFRLDKHWLNAVDQATATVLDATRTLGDGTSVTDDGALDPSTNVRHYPERLYAYLGAVVGGTTSITITGKNGKGSTTATWTATFTTSDTVGTIKEMTPSVFGDRVLDTLSIASSGWGGSGNVGFFVQKPYVGHTTGQAAPKARITLGRTDVAESQYDIQSNLTLGLIEDMRQSIVDGDGLDAVAEFLSYLRDDWRDAVDRQTITQIAEKSYSLNQATFDATAPPETMTDAKWKEQFHFYMMDTMAKVQGHSGNRPTWWLWSLADSVHIQQWITQLGLTRLDQDPNDPFSESRAKFSIGDAEVWVSENQVNNVASCGNNNRGGAHQYFYVPLQILQAQNPTASMEQVIMLHSRLYSGVPSDTKVNAGRSLGKITITR